MTVFCMLFAMGSVCQ